MNDVKSGIKDCPVLVAGRFTQVCA